MKNKEKNSNVTLNKLLFKSTDWDWLIIHSCVIYLFGKYALKHESLTAIILVVLCAVVFVFRDLAIVYKWWLYTDPPDPKYIKSHTLYIAIELIFTFLMGVFGKLWNEPFLLLMFIFWMFIIIREAVKTLKATYFVVKRWSKLWPRTL